MIKKILILLTLFIITGIFYYNIASYSERTTLFVARVIDGDTIETSTGQKLRLLGINTPERNNPGYSEAKEFLIYLIENKSIQVEITGMDRYQRGLSYLFIDNKNINEIILKKGLGTLYYYDKDQYYNNLYNAEKDARIKGRGIWKKSSNSKCIELIELRYKEERSIKIKKYL